MSDSGTSEQRLPRSSGTETQNESLMRGGIGFFGGLILCGAALIAQAALLHAIAGEKSH